MPWYQTKQDKNITRKKVPFLCTIKKQYHLPSKRIKYLEINLSKDIKELYSKDYKTLMKETEDNTNIWKDVKCSWAGKINIVKVTILHKTVTDSMQSYQDTKGIFSQNQKKKFNLYGNTKNHEYPKQH